jgi:hypothetical protein
VEVRQRCGGSERVGERVQQPAVRPGREVVEEEESERTRVDLQLLTSAARSASKANLWTQEETGELDELARASIRLAPVHSAHISSSRNNKLKRPRQTTESWREVPYGMKSSLCELCSCEVPTSSRAQLRFAHFDSSALPHPLYTLIQRR